MPQEANIRGQSVEHLIETHFRRQEMADSIKSKRLSRISNASLTRSKQITQM